MTEEEARAWLRESAGVSRETELVLESLAARVIAENASQNLISAATIPQIWTRHIVDSVQLLSHVPARLPAPWLDLGTGAGFPGLVIAALRPELPVLLVESRRRRADFLVATARELGLANVIVHGGRLELMESRPVSVISARAFAPLDRLLPLAHRFSRDGTIWLLPKGRTAREEVLSVTPAWHGVFHVEQSVTDADAAILVASNVRPKGKK